MFFPKVADAEIEFPKGDAKGPASQLVLHQNGRDMTAKRLDDAEAKKAAEAAAASDRRFKGSNPGAGERGRNAQDDRGIAGRQTNYDLLSPGLADATRQQLPNLQSAIGNLGALQSVNFKGVGPGGADIYQLKFG